MVLVPMNEIYICKRATEYFTNHVMLASDLVTTVFVILAEFNQIVMGLAKDEKVKQEMRFQVHSLFPELKQILMTSNPRTLLRGSHISQEYVVRL